MASSWMKNYFYFHLIESITASLHMLIIYASSHSAFSILSTFLHHLEFFFLAFDDYVYEATHIEMVFTGSEKFAWDDIKTFFHLFISPHLRHSIFSHQTTLISFAIFASAKSAAKRLNIIEERVCGSLLCTQRFPPNKVISEIYFYATNAKISKKFAYSS